MALNITNLFYSEKDIGATLKISKRQFIWEFELNGSSQRIELLDSRFSRKKRLYKNGVNILDTTETGNFLHNFEIDGHACVIIQYGDKIELRIDNQSFTHLYNLQKNKELFAGEKGPTSNTYVAKSFNAYSAEDKHTEDAFYKGNKQEEENKPKLFNFEIKKETGNKTSGGFNKFKFGVNKPQSTNSNNSNNINSNKQININNNSNQSNNNGNIDLLGFQDNQIINNTANNNNDLLDFAGNNSNNNQQNNGNDIFNIIGNNSQNQQNNSNNNNPFNNIFLQITDGTNQEPKFDQNNLGFLNLNNNNNNTNKNILNNNNNNINNLEKQINQNSNNSINQNNVQNNGTNIDFLQF